MSATKSDANDRLLNVFPTAQKFLKGATKYDVRVNNLARLLLCKALRITLQIMTLAINGLTLIPLLKCFWKVRLIVKVESIK